MPDPNKHAALAAHKFKIAETCSTCVHWAPTHAPWGYCLAIRYEHMKHTVPNHPIGTPGIGSCDKYDQNLRAIMLVTGDDYGSRYVKDDKS